MWYGGREEKIIEGVRAKKRRSEIAFRHRIRRRVILHFILKKHNGRILTGLP
jgi:hypothetical protein